LQYKWGYLKINSSLLSPSGIDIDEENSILYIADKTRVTRLNLKLEFLSSWEFPKQREFGWIFRGLKLDSNTVSLTIHGLHQIFLCNCQDGKILKEFGTVFSGTKDGEFHYPYGLTVDNKYVYICDNENHRVQILTKEGILFLPNGEMEYKVQIKDILVILKVFIIIHQKILFMLVTIIVFNYLEKMVLVFSD